MTVMSSKAKPQSVHVVLKIEAISVIAEQPIKYKLQGSREKAPGAETCLYVVHVSGTMICFKIPAPTTIT